MAGWVDVDWDDYRITVCDESGLGGRELRIMWPDGSTVFGVLSLEPHRQNDSAVMARLREKHFGDTYVNIHGSIPAIWLSTTTTETRTKSIGDYSLTEPVTKEPVQPLSSAHTHAFLEEILREGLISQHYAHVNRKEEFLEDVQWHDLKMWLDFREYVRTH